MGTQEKPNFARLQQLAVASRGILQPCTCAIETFREWTRTPLDFPQQQIREIGTLLDDPYVEPTHAEYHSQGSAYWSPDAPIAPRYYPYNRCSVQQCTVCGRCCLAYVEAGGYYVEPRVRALLPELLVDAPLADGTG
jgi:hypothetical protein